MYNDNLERHKSIQYLIVGLKSLLNEPKNPEAPFV